MSRRAGLLIPLFSIRTRNGAGVGEIPDLVPLAQWAARAGFTVIQLLPVNEAAHGQSSPYFARTAFALDPAYLRVTDVEDFHSAGRVSAPSDAGHQATSTLAQPTSTQVDWGPLRAVKRRALELACRAFVEFEWSKQTARAAEFVRWSEEHAHWLDDYALFSALGEAFVANGGHGGWDAWPAPVKERHPAAIDEARARLGGRLLFFRYVQWQLDRQWREARRRVAQEGVTLMGDLPFMVAGDSADVWQRAGEFQLDATIGAPPDAFSANGQDWGLPAFRWELMRERDYEWMRQRAARAAELFGLYRIDHAVGLFRTYCIAADKHTKGFSPADEPSQIAQGERLLEILKGGAQGESPVIAEDLGVVPDFVRRSIARLKVPGYKVLRWEVDGSVFRDVAKYPALSVATTGTHDTESLADWYDALSPARRVALCAIPNMAALSVDTPPQFNDRVRDTILETVYRAGSDLVLIPFQDAFGHRERVNVPGTLNEHNWSYRMPWSMDELARRDADTARLLALARLR